MMARLRRRDLGVAIVALWAMALVPGAASAFPDKPVNLVVGFAAGGGTDAYARGLAAVAPKYLDGQPIAVVNQPGGAGIPAAAGVADAPPDGYTLHLSSLGGFLLREIAQPQVVHPIDGFRYIGTVGGLTTGLMVPATSPFEAVEDIVEAARERPGELRWAHSGRGAAHYTAGIGFLLANGIEAQDVPFSGGGTARGAVVSGDVDFAFLGTQQARGFEEEIRLLAVAAEERLSADPDIATFKELGVGYLGMMAPITVQAPKDTPDEIVAYLAAAFEGMANDPEYIEAMTKAGLPVLHEGPEESLATAKRLMEEWTPVIEATLEEQ